MQERGRLAVVRLHEGMRHGTEHRYPEARAGHGRGAPVEAGEERGAGRQHARFRAVRAAHAEVDERLPGAASTERAALEATIVSKCSRFSSRVSTSCASGIGAVTRRIGSFGKNTVPSGIA